MTNEEVIVWLKSIKKGFYPWSDKVMNEICDVCISALSVPEREKGEWMPVSSVEEISKEAVWVTRKGTDYAYVELIGWDSERNCRTEDGGFRCNNSDLKDVVAYMPYSEPEPYKAEEGGDI